MYGIQPCSQGEEVKTSVFANESCRHWRHPLGPPFHTAHAHTPCEGRWLRMRCGPFSLLVGEWFRQGRHRIPIIRAQAAYTQEIWSLYDRRTHRAPAEGVCGCGLVELEPSHRDRWTLPCLLSHRKMFALLGALNSIPHLSAQVAAASRSALRLAQLDAVDLPAVCTLVSSTHRWNTGCGRTRGDG